jgi:oligoribonuclease NrnB/cAMP/cGMP phosphodiesterase (DHH superfamily)
VEQVRGKRVLVVDICWSPSDMERMHQSTESLVVLDHHETSMKAFAQSGTPPYVHFDMQKSGILLAQEYFFPTQELPRFLDCLARRDLWKHEGNDAELFTTAFSAEYTFTSFARFLDEDKVSLTMAQGHAILKYKKNVVAEMASVATTHMLTAAGNQYTVRLVNVGHPWISDVGHALCATRPDVVAMLWSKEARQRVSFSLRSHESGPNVGEIAQAFGGGGHAHAAAFRSDMFPEEFLGPKIL